MFETFGLSIEIISKYATYGHPGGSPWLSLNAENLVVGNSPSCDTKVANPHDYFVISKGRAITETVPKPQFSTTT